MSSLRSSRNSHLIHICMNAYRFRRQVIAMAQPRQYPPLRHIQAIMLGIELG